MLQVKHGKVYNIIKIVIFVIMILFFLALQNGCSVRFLNPQAFSQSVWKLTSLLQEYFGCLVGANV